MGLFPVISPIDCRGKITFNKRTNSTVLNAFTGRDGAPVFPFLVSFSPFKKRLLKRKGTP